MIKRLNFNRTFRTTSQKLMPTPEHILANIINGIIPKAAPIAAKGIKATQVAVKKDPILGYCIIGGLTMLGSVHLINERNAKRDTINLERDRLML